MMRIPSAAAVLLACAASVLRAQDPAELALTHFAGDQEVATSRLLISRFEVRVKGQSKPSKGQDAVELVALLQLSERGGIKRYDRELKSARDGSVASAVSVVAEDDTLSLRETGPMGVRTKSVTGPSVDFVVDGSCPEMFIPFMLDRARKSVRVLVLPDLEIKTVVLEDRGELGRYAAIPGGGVTLFLDPQGGFLKLALPGPELRVIVRAGAESRPAPPKGRETPMVLNLDGRSAPRVHPDAAPDGRPAVSGHPSPLRRGRARSQRLGRRVADPRPRAPVGRARRPGASRPCARTSAAWGRAPAPTRGFRVSSTMLTA